jgi:hypothetical protein
VISRLQRCHAGPAFEHFTAALVTENRRKRAFGVFTGKGKRVCMANPGGMHFQQYFTLFRAGYFDFLYFQGFLGFPRDRGSGFHGYS